MKLETTNLRKAPRLTAFGRSTFIAIFAAVMSYGGSVRAESSVSNDGLRVWVMTDAEAAEAKAARADHLGPARAIFGDWNSDGLPDMAVFSDPDITYQGTLEVFEGTRGGRMIKVAELTNAFAAKIEAGLYKRSDTSFSVTSGGATARWASVVTTVITYRDGGYVIAGVEHTNQDFEAGRTETCSWNIRLGRVEYSVQQGNDAAVKTVETTEASNVTLSDFATFGVMAGEVCERVSQ